MNYKSRTHVDLHVVDAINRDFLAKWGSDAKMLQEALADTPINIVAHSAVDAPTLRQVLREIATYRDTYIHPRHSVPYIHISCHGRKDRLDLGEDDEMTWNELSEALLPVLNITDYHLAISLSSCSGYHGAALAYLMSDTYGKRRPYYSLVGPAQPEQPHALCNAFAKFYRCLLVDFKSLRKSIQLANQVGVAELDYTKGSTLVDRLSNFTNLFGNS